MDDMFSATKDGLGRKDEFMNRRIQAQVALLAALVFLLVGLALAAVLVAGLLAGVATSAGLLLGALTIGMFALSIRLILLARSAQKQPPARPVSTRAQEKSRAPKPRPRPAARPGTRTR
jgi:hypothetical protein